MLPLTSARAFYTSSVDYLNPARQSKMREWSTEAEGLKLEA
jgi:hypothetical protein